MPVFELVSDDFQGIDQGRRSHPALLDHDGDADVLSGGLGGGLVFMESRGAPTG